MYVAVKGGEKAIDAAHALQESRRRGDTDLPELSVAQIEQQLNLAVDRVMTEGGIADRELAALALKQASGDNVEAIFLLRAYRTTLAKLAVSEPLDTTGMRLERRAPACITRRLTHRQRRRMRGTPRPFRQWKINSATLAVCQLSTRRRANPDQTR